MLRALAVSACLATPAASCELALALAVDISGSVDPQEYDIQMRGLAAALRDSAVAEALVRAEAAVMLVQWTGASRQELTIPWVRVQSFADAEALAARIEAAPRRWRNFSTAIGDALEFTLKQWDSAPDCARRVIDLSGDGVSNEGAEPRTLHPMLARHDVTVNALAIETGEEDLTAYFFEHVIHGDGAFVATANGFADYPARIRQKLMREVTAQISCAAPVCWGTGDPYPSVNPPQPIPARIGG